MPARQYLGAEKLRAILCVAGGWGGGSAASEDLVQVTELMFKQSVWTSVVSAQVAAHHLAPGGTLVLTGALAALQGTPGMIGYGMAKVSQGCFFLCVFFVFWSGSQRVSTSYQPHDQLQSAVHHLVASLAQADSGMPADSVAVGILPVTLDTPMNRKYMPAADHSSWTPLETLTQCVAGAFS